MKKHITQMNEQEVEYLMSRFRSRARGSWYVSAYCSRRLMTRKIKPSQLLDLFDVNRLIEYHYSEFDRSERILLRGQSFSGRELCAVFNLTNGQIVTLWTNSEHNQHTNIQMCEYDETAQILPRRTEAV